jgi:inner membrane protein
LVVIFAGSLPDIDLPKSKIGKKVKPLSMILNFLFGHRGILHSIFVPFAVLLMFYYFKHLEVGLAFFIGYLSHLIGDSLSYEGLSMFNPVSKFRIRGFVRVGGIFEYLIFLVLLALSFLFIGRLF